MIRLLCMSTLFIVTSLAGGQAQDSLADNQMTSRRKILGELSRKEKALVKTYKERLAEIKAYYSKTLHGYRAESIKALNDLQAEIAASDLDEAINLRDAAQLLAKKSTAAPNASSSESGRIRELLTTISQLEEEVRHLKSPISPLVGEWSGKFENGFKLQLVIRNDGYCVISTRPRSDKAATLPILIKNNRVLLLRKGHNLIQEHLELIRSGDRLVALGWTTTKKSRDPFTDLPNITATFERSGQQIDESKSQN